MESVGVESLGGVTRCQLRSIKRMVVLRWTTSAISCRLLVALFHLEETHLSWWTKASSLSGVGWRHWPPTRW